MPTQGLVLYYAQKYCQEYKHRSLHWIPTTRDTVSSVASVLRLTVKVLLSAVVLSSGSPRDDNTAAPSLFSIAVLCSQDCPERKQPYRKYGDGLEALHFLKGKFKLAMGVINLTLTTGRLCLFKLIFRILVQGMTFFPQCRPGPQSRFLQPRGLF